jgi:hypothetical protein
MAKAKKRGKGASKKGGRRRQLITRVRADASAFLNSEEGKMIKKDIIKTAIALGLVASASALDPDRAEAFHTNSHSDVVHGDAAHADAVTHILHNDAAQSYHQSGSHADAVHSNSPHVDSHANHGSHANHANHSAHSSGGWC